MPDQGISYLPGYDYPTHWRGVVRLTLSEDLRKPMRSLIYRYAPCVRHCSFNNRIS